MTYDDIYKQFGDGYLNIYFHKNIPFNSNLSHKDYGVKGILSDITSESFKEAFNNMNDSDIPFVIYKQSFSQNWSKNFGQILYFDGEDYYTYFENDSLSLTNESNFKHHLLELYDYDISNLNKLKVMLSI